MTPTTKWTCLALTLLLSISSAPAAETPLTPDQQLAIVQSLAPSAVTVEITLQYDNGEAPYGSGWSTRCPNCGQYHGEDTERYVQDERPMELPGLLIAPDRVITADVTLHKRFIKSIAVRSGNRLVPAAPAAYAREHNALFLELKQPLPNAKALAFDAARKGPYLTVTRAQLNGDWSTTIQPLGIKSTATDRGRKFVSVGSYALVVDQSGVPVGLCMNDQIPPNDSWKGTPTNWPTFSAQEIDGILGNLEEQAASAMLRVALSYRSPKASSARDRYMPRDEDERTTPRNVAGILLDNQRIMILANLKSGTTARLQRIMVYPGQGAAVPAKFSHTLSDLGCFIATLDKPLPGIPTLSTADIRTHADRLVFCVEVRVNGEKRTAYFGHRRIASFELGFRRQITPQLPGRGQQQPFLLDDRGSILAIPVARREKLSLEERYSYNSNNLSLLAASDIARTLQDLAANSDPANVPLSDADESRLAWLGIELQGLTPELARANNVSDLTTDGQSGALVTFVHPNSPAAKGGIGAGDVLLRLHAAGQPKPVDVRIEDRHDTESFPWDRMDEVSEQYFDQIPKPWPSVDNSFNRILTELGFGKSFVVEFVHEGNTVKHPFTVIAGPTHFDSAPRFKADAIGLTVRDLTYEVRRYFQRKDDDPGVIISKVEQGSKASTSGLKPYEIITHVNDQPIATVKDFQKLTEGQTNLRLSVKRMAKGRQVIFTLPARPSPATSPAR
ncbi:MAG: PDZ domain-containing protein [Planctomycetota bacterium]|nr:PDZ domain-containing protein [Planctomycetota bacterium]